MKLPILLYHKIDRIPAGARYPRSYVTPERFDAQLAFLRRRGYESVSFVDYLGYRRGAARLPRRPVIITFDDGYRSNRDVALPLLQQHGFRATIFLVAERVGGTNAWDPDEIQEPLLDAAAIRAMQARGIEFGSHSATHARLTALDPAAGVAGLGDELHPHRAGPGRARARAAAPLRRPRGDGGARGARSAGAGAADPAQRSHGSAGTGARAWRVRGRRRDRGQAARPAARRARVARPLVRARVSPQRGRGGPATGPDGAARLPPRPHDDLSHACGRPGGVGAGPLHEPPAVPRDLRGREPGAVPAGSGSRPRLRGAPGTGRPPIGPGRGRAGAREALRLAARGARAARGAPAPSHGVRRWWARRRAPRASRARAAGRAMAGAGDAA